jgi:hypothetical protein
MVGLTSSDGAFLIEMFPDFYLQAGEPKFYLKNFQ